MVEIKEPFVINFLNTIKHKISSLESIDDFIPLIIMFISGFFLGLITMYLYNKRCKYEKIVNQPTNRKDIKESKKPNQLNVNNNLQGDQVKETNNLKENKNKVINVDNVNQNIFKDVNNSTTNTTQTKINNNQTTTNTTNSTVIDENEWKIAKKGKNKPK
jgi:hypothetical protein